MWQTCFNVARFIALKKTNINRWAQEKRILHHRELSSLMTSLVDAIFSVFLTYLIKQWLKLHRFLSVFWGVFLLNHVKITRGLFFFLFFFNKKGRGKKHSYCSCLPLIMCVSSDEICSQGGLASYSLWLFVKGRSLKLQAARASRAQLYSLRTS